MEKKVNINDTLQSKLYEAFNEFEHQVAIKNDNNEITYNELNKRTDCLAQEMSNLKGKCKKIAILLDNTLLIIEYIIAILKNRDVFIPINYDYPIMKINEMLNDVEVDLIITDWEKEGMLNENLKDKCRIHKDMEYCEKNYVYEKKNFIYSAKCNDDIYIFFTSGSTGKPRAIKGRNGSLVHYLQWEISKYNMYRYKFAQLTNPSFDPFLREIFVPLLSGGTIVLRTKRNLIFSSKHLKKWIEEENIDVIHSTPSLINSFAKNITDRVLGVKYIFSAGQKLYSKDVRLWNKVFSEETCFVNLYGPTETTLAKCYYEINRKNILEGIIPVGKPISETEVMVMDDDLKECDINVVGEICIITEHLSNGYCDEAYNSKKFVCINSKKAFLTGDLGYKNQNGNLTLIGRKDRQIKINGIRIELEEIENVLLKLEEVEEAVVIFIKNKLYAFIKKAREISNERIRQFLLLFLLPACIPSKIIFVDEIPVNENGKISYKDLENSVKG